MQCISAIYITYIALHVTVIMTKVKKVTFCRLSATKQYKLAAMGMGCGEGISLSPQ
jgi:hypothetical protein